MPPVTDKLIDPVEFPQQRTFVLLEMDVERGVLGWDMLTEVVAVQLLASVTVTLYVPAITLLRSWLVAPLLQM